MVLPWSPSARPSTKATFPGIWSVLCDSPDSGAWSSPRSIQHQAVTPSGLRTVVCRDASQLRTQQPKTQNEKCVQTDDTRSSLSVGTINVQGRQWSRHGDETKMNRRVAISLLTRSLAAGLAFRRCAVAGASSTRYQELKRYAVPEARQAVAVDSAGIEFRLCLG